MQKATSKGDIAYRTAEDGEVARAVSLSTPSSNMGYINLCVLWSCSTWGSRIPIQ